MRSVVRLQEDGPERFDSSSSEERERFCKNQGKARYLVVSTALARRDGTFNIHGLGLDLAAAMVYLDKESIPR